MGLNLESTELNFPKFLRREGDFNFRILKDILEPAKSEMTYKDFERCVDFNLPNHIVKVSLLNDIKKEDKPKTINKIKNEESEKKTINSKLDDMINQEQSERRSSNQENNVKNESIFLSNNDHNPDFAPKKEEVYQDDKERDFLINKMAAREAFLDKNILFYGDAKPIQQMNNEVLISKDIDPEQYFVKLFVKIEMGRQNVMDGRNKERIIRENKRKAMKNNNKKIGNEEEMDSKKVEAAIQLQKFIRGVQARKRTKEFRRKKMKFLGLSIFNEHKPRDQNKEEFELMQLVKEIEQKRKEGINKKLNEIMEQRKIIKEELKENEGPEMMEKMLQERREFILNFFEMNEGKQLPKNEKVFYDRFELKDIKNLEENAKKMKKKNKSKKLIHTNKRKPKKEKQQKIKSQTN
jgi:hypothetical protein